MFSVSLSSKDLLFSPRNFSKSCWLTTDIYSCNCSWSASRNAISITVLLLEENTFKVKTVVELFKRSIVVQYVLSVNDRIRQIFHSIKLVLFRALIVNTSQLKYDCNLSSQFWRNPQLKTTLPYFLHVLPVVLTYRYALIPNLYTVFIN